MAGLLKQNKTKETLLCDVSTSRDFHFYSLGLHFISVKIALYQKKTTTKKEKSSFMPSQKPNNKNEFQDGW